MDVVAQRLTGRCTLLADGCLSWPGAVDGCGYPHFGHQRKTLRVFRYLYETLVAPIPEGHQLHHECENKWCVNPLHMRPVTRSEHYSISKALAGRKLKTHCMNGHELAGANIRMINGHRRCMVCVRVRDRSRNQHRPCPLCGNDMDRGSTKCRECWRLEVGGYRSQPVVP